MLFFRPWRYGQEAANNGRSDLLQFSGGKGHGVPGIEKSKDSRAAQNHHTTFIFGPLFKQMCFSSPRRQSLICFYSGTYHLVNGKLNHKRSISFSFSNRMLSSSYFILPTLSPNSPCFFNILKIKIKFRSKKNKLNY